VLSRELASTGISRLPFKNNKLKMPNCLREAGVGQLLEAQIVA